MLPPGKRKIVARVAGEAAGRELIFEGRPLEAKI